ncbi:MAG: hypothetical protein HQL37_01620 [Alphaproteobacteria bacterium]|nr:hypothetical protein [Alphaproteobacteria bacterium]
MTQPAVAYTGQGVDVFAPAAADLSSSQFNIVKLTSTGVAVCSATTDRPFGILQNTPTAGQGALVRVLGASRCVSGASGLTMGSVVAPTASGAAQAAVSTQYPVGWSMAAASSGDTFTVHVHTAWSALP